MSRAVVGDLIDAIKVGDIAEVLVDRADRAPGGPTPPAPVPAARRPARGSLDRRGARRVRGPDRPAARRPDRGLGALPVDARRFAVRRRDPPGRRDAARAARSAPPADHASSTELVTTVQHSPAASATAGAESRWCSCSSSRSASRAPSCTTGCAADRTYHSLLLVREHDIYLRGAIPAEFVAPPGVDYFVEVSTPRGGPASRSASPSAPMSLEVAPPPLTERFAATPGLSA